MPSCARCGMEWPEGYVACPNDGSRLGSGQLTMPASSGSLAVAAAVDDELPAGSFAGDYRIEGKIGEGGMGAVYAARHPLIGKRAAIKVLLTELSESQSAVDRFVREAQAVNQIGHPNIVDVFAFGRLEDGRSFIAMELLQGQSLRARLQRPMSMGDAVDIIDTIAKALQAAHEANVVHRDLKPDNVFLASVRDDRPVVKLLDFGLAKLQGPGEQRMERTRTGMVMGTPLYLSPEQAKGVRVDATTDIYSLGAMAYEMFTGQVPFMAPSAVEIMSKHITDTPRPPQELVPYLPPVLADLVTAMLAKEPHQRPSLKQVRDAVAMFRTMSSQAVFPPPPPPPLPMPAHSPPRRARRGIVLVAAVAGGVAAGAIAYAVVSLRERTEEVHVSAPPAPAPAPTTTPPPAPAPTPPPAQAPAPPPAPAPTPPPAQAPAPAPPPPPHATHAAPARPKPPPPPLAKTGTLSVHVVGPPHAQVTVDGHIPLTFGGTVELLPGTHEIRVEAPNWRPVTQSIAITAGKATAAQITMSRIVDVRDPYAGGGK